MVLSAFYPFVHWEHPRKDAGVALHIAQGTLAPLPAGLIGVHAFPAVRVAGGEVQHPCRIGPDLVEAGIQRVLQLERAVGLSVLDNQFLGFHGIADGIEQLHVEDAAQVGEVQIVVAHDVSLVPDVLSFIIRGVVEVNIYTFRREHIGEAFEVLLPLEQQRVGVGTYCRQEACKPKYQSQYQLFHTLFVFRFLGAKVRFFPLTASLFTSQTLHNGFTNHSQTLIPAGKGAKNGSYRRPSLPWQRFSGRAASAGS